MDRIPTHQQTDKKFTHCLPAVLVSTHPESAVSTPWHFVEVWMCGFQGQIDFDGWLLGSPKLIFSIHTEPCCLAPKNPQHRISGLKSLFAASASSYHNTLQNQSWTFRTSNLLQGNWSPLHMWCLIEKYSLLDRLLIIMHFAVICTYKSRTYIH